VLVEGAGSRGLCAGGDIRRLYTMGPAGHEYFKNFWREEYQLNARIASFPKPYVAIMDGLTMGGGVGISAHGNRRIVTERSRIAMPETGIGFIPDVGGTWLLTRDVGVGLYMALSGVSFGAADAIHAGLADTFVASARLGEAVRQLAAIRDARDVDDILSRFSDPPGEAPLARHAPLLDRAMRGARVEDIIDALRADGSDFAHQAADEIGGRSPTALKVTHELLKRGAAAERLEDCLASEFRAASRLLETHDLYEGIRAAIIDKDRRPRWAPATLGEVDEATVRAIVAGAGNPDPRFEPPRTYGYETAPT
jgi:enoyl-CoA hydratase